MGIALTKLLWLHYMFTLVYVLSSIFDMLVKAVSGLQLRRAVLILKIDSCYKKNVYSLHPSVKCRK